MTNITTTTKPTGPAMPAPQTPAQRRTLAALTSGATTEGGKMVLLPGKEISADERRGMEGRLSTLRRYLDERNRPATEAIVSAFLASYGSSRGSDHEARLVVGTYASVLAEIPPWAVAETARAWTRGGYGATASAFAPSAAQFYEAASRIIRGYSREADDLAAVLAAETQPTPEGERDRVMERMGEVRANLAEAAGEKPRETTVNARLRYEEMCREAGVHPDDTKDLPPSMQRLHAPLPTG